MREEAQQRLDELAAAVADGRPLNWDDVESSADSDDERAAIRRLRAIAAIGQAHAELTFSDTVTGSLSVRSQLPGFEDPSVPTHWGPLRILERVGRGRFGDVYRAWDPSLDREVALKLLRRRTEDGHSADREVIEEGRLMARVRHDNVVTIHGAQRIDGRTGLWMEFVRGRTLEAELKDRGPFPAAEIAELGIQLCKALTAVHESGLVHRDVKTQNVLRDTGGRVLLGDFGTGYELDDDGGGPSEIAGTPAYLAPEIFKGAPATPQSDLYSLGVLLFHLASGSYPVLGRSISQIRTAHHTNIRRSIEQLRPDLPTALAGVIDRATDPDAGRRFTAAAAMEAALAAAVQSIERVDRGISLGIKLLAAALIVVVTGAAIWTLSSKARNANRNPGQTSSAFAANGSRVFRQIGGADLAGPGVPSPDGRVLSFVAGGELTLYDVVSRGRRRLTGPESGDSPGFVEGSRFSLDGSRITYVRFASQADPDQPSIPEIRSIPSAGGRSRLIWRGADARYINFYHWAGDDDQILLSRWPDSGKGELLIVSAAEGVIRASHELPTAPSLTGASMSPDGRFVAFEQVERATGRKDIHVWDVLADRVTTLVRDDANDESPVWARDGQHVLFFSNRSGRPGLWAQRVQEGVPVGPARRLDPDLGSAMPMGGLTDAGALFVRREIGTRDVFAVDVDPYSLAPSQEARRVTNRPGQATGMAGWSPDSKQLAFIRRDGERRSLVVRSMADGREQEYWTPGLAWVARPRWEPEGRSILFKTVIDDVGGLSRLDVESGTISPVLTRTFNEFELLPQPGVVVIAERPKRRILRLDLHTGREEVIYRAQPPSSLTDMGVSNLGDRLAFSSPFGGNKGVAVRLLDLTAPYRVREIFRTPPGTALWAYDWSVDDREVIIGRNVASNGQKDGKDHLWAVDVATGRARHIGIEIDGGLHNLRSSPDGRHLSFDSGFPYQEVWVLENVAALLPH